MRGPISDPAADLTCADENTTSAVHCPAVSRCDLHPAPLLNTLTGQCPGAHSRALQLRRQLFGWSPTPFILSRLTQIVSASDVLPQLIFRRDLSMQQSEHLVLLPSSIAPIRIVCCIKASVPIAGTDHQGRVQFRHTERQTSF